MDPTASVNNDIIETIENEEEILDDSEERELVTDSCSTKVLDSSEQPCDRYWIVYILFYLFGVTSLVPWNFLITANDYWMYKFRDVNPSNLTMVVRKTQFQAEFTSYLNVATAVPNLIFLILNSLYGHLVSIKSRLQGSLIVIMLSFLVTTALVQVNTDDWQNGFFIVTIVTVVIMTAASAVFIGGLIGIASRFSKEYMGAVVSGQSLGAVARKVALPALTMFTVFAVTMAVYPAVTVLVESHPTTAGTDWNNIYFVPVVNYLIFNCGDYSGRLVAGFLLKPTNQWVVAGASVVRVAGVAMLMLCNAQPRRHLPVVFPWDWEYIIIMILFAFSNGYLTNIIMINTTRAVAAHEREQASSLLAAALSLGLAAGAAAGLLLVRLV